MKQFVTYLRVSTQKQGASGLGLEAQRKMCQAFVDANKGVISKEFVDVESGTHRDRKGLWDAIEFCNTNNMPLVIAKLDRLARDVEFTFKVINTGIDIHFTDMPAVNTMILGVFASVAQYERELVSQRTKAALQAKIAAGGKIGRASANYQISMENEKKRAEASSSTQKRHFQENKDTIALVRIMKKVFPRCAETPEELWEQNFVNTKMENRTKIFQMMCDHKEIDPTLFAKWNLTENNVGFQNKIASKMQCIIKSFKKK